MPALKEWNIPKATVKIRKVSEHTIPLLGWVIFAKITFKKTLKYLILSSCCKMKSCWI